MRGNSALTSCLLGLGLLLVWVGERVVEAGTARLVASGLGALLVVLAAALRWRRVPAPGKEEAQRRDVERLLLGLHGLSALGLACYFLQSDAFARVAGQALEVGSPRLAGALGALWPAVVAASVFPTLLVELAYAAMARAPRLEVDRVREATRAGLGLAFALTFAFATQYVVTARDAKADLSYFRMARPGDATKKLVGSLDSKLEAFLFFPPASDSGELVQAYFDELKGQSPMLSVTRYDHALEPMKAKDLGVSGNGVVVVKKGERKESIYLGVEVEKAKTQLRGLDAEVQKRLLQVAKTRRTVYLTAGHGERTQDPVGGTEQRATIEILYKTLQDQNFDVRTLSAAEGLGVEVPKDAAAVFVVSPQRAFAEGEAAALTAYARRGGRLFLALDPENGLPFDELLAPLGLVFKPALLANDQVYGRLKPTYSPSDQLNLGTRSFSSHPAVTYLARYNAVLLMMGAGAVEERPQHPVDLVLDFAVRAHPQTWDDANNNLKPDVPPETRKAWGLAAAVTRRGASNKPEEELRALVLGDSDGLADDLLPAVQGNQFLVLDGLKWLLGEEQLQGATNTEQDLPLARTRQEDALWFYGTTFFAPLAVVGVGFLARRRATGPKKAKEKEARP